MILVDARRLARIRRVRGPRLSEELMKIAARCARLPVKDTRSDKAILGYDERGVRKPGKSERASLKRLEPEVSSDMTGK